MADAPEATPTPTPSPAPTQGKKVGAPVVSCGDGMPSKCAGQGLASAKQQEQLSNAFKGVRDGWTTMDSTGRADAIGKAINGTIGPGYAPVKVVPSDVVKDGHDAHYDSVEHAIHIPREKLESNSPEVMTGISSTVAHEARHAEQFNIMARAEAGNGANAKAIQRDLKVSPAVAANAVENPIKHSENPDLSVCAAQLKNGYVTKKACMEDTYKQQLDVFEESQQAQRDSGVASGTLGEMIKGKVPRTSPAYQEAQKNATAATQEAARAAERYGQAQAAYSNIPHEGDAESVGAAVGNLTSNWGK